MSARLNILNLFPWCRERVFSELRFAMKYENCEHQNDFGMFIVLGGNHGSIMRLIGMINIPEIFQDFKVFTVKIDHLLSS